jgi:hypothetical protein
MDIVGYRIPPLTILRTGEYYSDKNSCDILRIIFIGQLTAAIGDTIAIIFAPGQAKNW